MLFSKIYNFFVNIFTKMCNLGNSSEYTKSNNEGEFNEIEYNKLLNCDTSNKYTFVIIQD